MGKAARKGSCGVMGDDDVSEEEEEEGKREEGSV
jgi:hypothetical protein